MGQPLPLHYGYNYLYLSLKFEYFFHHRKQRSDKTNWPASWKPNMLFYCVFKAAASEETTAATAAFIRWQLHATFPERCRRVPACSSRPLSTRRGSATQAASWWAVDEVRGHCRAKWDLTLDKQARPWATMAYGCEGGEEAKEGCGGVCKGGQAVHPASHETPSCHNRHLPALTLNTHQGGGGEEEEHPSSFKQKDGGEEGWREKRG